MHPCQRLRIDTNRRATPFFFTKEDADLAVMSAYTAKEKRQMQHAQEVVRRAREEVDKLSGELAKATEADNKKLVRRFTNQLDKAEKKLQKAERRLSNANTAAKRPKIEARIAPRGRGGASRQTLTGIPMAGRVLRVGGPADAGRRQGRLDRGRLHPPWVHQGHAGRRGQGGQEEVNAVSQPA